MSEAGAWALVIVAGSAVVVWVCMVVRRTERQAARREPCPIGGCSHPYRGHGYVAVLSGDLPQQGGYRCGAEGCRCGWPTP